MRSIHYPHILKQFGLSLIIALVAVGFTVVQADTISFHAARDCNDDAIISCGSLTSGELLNAYDANSYAQKVYAYFGISRGDINNLPLNGAAGHVDNSGNVYIDGKSSPVAANAITAGRRDVNGSTKAGNGGVSFYQRPLSGSLKAQSTDAFVVLDKGSFKYAIIASGDYPVMATPKVAAAKPAAPKSAPAKPAAPATPAKPAVPATTAPAAPTQIVNTGPIDAKALALFAAVIAGSTAAAYRYQLRRAGK